MPEVGDTLGRYTLLKRLAAGGMGEVYVAAKAGPVGFGPHVALKVLRDELSCDPQFVEMLVDEANISKFLNHQNVVSVLDLGEDDQSYFIAMEYVQGITVERLVESLSSQQKKLPLPVGLHIGIELCRALKYAHTRVNHEGDPLNIVHRDVTPANILLSIQGEVKLTDFGIARAKGRIHQTQAGVLKGKFGYMAPEMVRYEQIDARADLFCAGVCLYLMFSGEHPVAGAAVMEAIQKYENQQIPPPSKLNREISTNLDEIVMRALEPRVENRWSTAADLGDALQDALLSNPSWRGFAKDGPRLVVEQIRQVAAESFVPPVSEDQIARLLAAAPRPTRPSSTSGHFQGVDGFKGPLGANRPGAPLMSRPPSHNALPTTAESTPLSFDSSDSMGGIDLPTATELEPVQVRGSSGLGDVETDEQLSVDRVRQVHAELSGRPQIKDTDEQMPAPSGTEDLPPEALGVGLTPVGHSPPGVAFPDSSTDRNEMDFNSDPTLMPPSFDEGVIDRPIELDSDSGDDRTVIGFEAEETVGGQELMASPTLAISGEDSVSEIANDKTVAGGMSLGDIEADHRRQQGGGARVFDEQGDLIDASGGSEDFETDDWDQGTLQDASGLAGAVAGGDATLLDGINDRAVHEAIAQARAEVGVSRSRPDGEGASASAPASTSERSDSMASMEALVMDAVQTGEYAAADPAQDPGPALLSGPIRIAVSEENLASRLPEPIKDPGGPVARPAQERRAPLLKDEGPGREPHPGAVSVDSRGGPAGPPANLKPMDGLSVGAATGRWIAGELDAHALDWDDDAAARRAVATRNQGQGNGPPPGGPGPTGHDMGVGTPAPPSVSSPDVYPHAAPPPASFVARHGLNLLLVLAVVVLASLMYALFFTKLFWPRIELGSKPSEAQVVVIRCSPEADCSQSATIERVLVPHRTPVKVQVDPGRRHRIEYRKAGYRPEIRDVGVMSRFGTYKLEVDLSAKVVRMTAEGEVFINGASIGRGREVPLHGVPSSGAVEVSVKAPGYLEVKRTFTSESDIPNTLDIKLSKP